MIFCTKLGPDSLKLLVVIYIFSHQKGREEKKTSNDYKICSDEVIDSQCLPL